MTVLRTDLGRRTMRPPPMKGAGAPATQSTPTAAAQRNDQEEHLPMQYRKPAVMKPMAPDRTAAIHTNESTQPPLAIYSSEPLNQVLERLSFQKKKRGRPQGAGVKLTI